MAGALQFGDQPQGEKSELDLEIEKYQREIEEKRTKMRATGTFQFAPAHPQPDVHEMQPYPGPGDQSNHFKAPLEAEPVQQPPQPQQQQAMYVQPEMLDPQQHSSIFEFEAELEGATAQRAVSNDSSHSTDSAIFFTSVDTNAATKQKKPGKPPVNPKLKAQQQQQQPQKGIMSKLFQKNQGQ